MERIIKEKIIIENDKFKIVEITKEIIEPSLYGNKLRVINGFTITAFVKNIKETKKIFF